MACGGDEGPLEPNREAPIRVGLGLIATTETFDFGEVRVGTRTPFQTLRLRNSSGVLLENVRLRRLAGFREDAFWAEIHPALISPFGERDLWLGFSAVEEGLIRSSIEVFADWSGGTLSQRIELRGTGVPASDRRSSLQSSSPRLDFGGVILATEELQYPCLCSRGERPPPSRILLQVRYSHRLFIKSGAVQGAGSAPERHLVAARHHLIRGS